MYSIILAAFLVPSTEAPAFGHRHGCCGGRGMVGCYGCYGWVGCYGCYGCCGCVGCMGAPAATCSGTGQGGGGGGQSGKKTAQASGEEESQAAAGQAAESPQGSQEGDGQAAGLLEFRQAIKDLKASVEEVRKDQAQQRAEVLKRISEESGSRATEQALLEIRRDIEWLKRRVSGGTVPSPAPQPVSKPIPIPPQTNRPGKIELQLPSNALLHVNNERVDALTDFVTPPLEPGQDYHYDLEVSFIRDGKALTRIKRVTLRAGEVIHLTVEDMIPPQWSALPGSYRDASPARHSGARLTVLAP